MRHAGNQFSSVQFNLADLHLVQIKPNVYQRHATTQGASLVCFATTFSSVQFACVRRPCPFTPLPHVLMSSLECAVRACVLSNEAKSLMYSVCVAPSEDNDTRWAEGAYCVHADWNWCAVCVSRSLLSNPQPSPSTIPPGEHAPIMFFFFHFPHLFCSKAFF